MIWNGPAFVGVAWTFNRQPSPKDDQVDTHLLELVAGSSLRVGQLRSRILRDTNKFSWLDHILM